MDTQLENTQENEETSKGKFRSFAIDYDGNRVGLFINLCKLILQEFEDNWEIKDKQDNQCTIKLTEDHELKSLHQIQADFLLLEGFMSDGEMVCTTTQHIEAWGEVEFEEPDVKPTIAKVINKEIENYTDYFDFWKDEKILAMGENNVLEQYNIIFDRYHNAEFDLKDVIQSVYPLEVPPIFRLVEDGYMENAVVQLDISKLNENKGALVIINFNSKREASGIFLGVRNINSKQYYYFLRDENVDRVVGKRLTEKDYHSRTKHAFSNLTVFEVTEINSIFALTYKKRIVNVMSLAGIQANEYMPQFLENDIIPGNEYMLWSNEYERTLYGVCVAIRDGVICLKEIQEDGNARFLYPQSKEVSSTIMIGLGGIVAKDVEDSEKKAGDIIYIESKKIRKYVVELDIDKYQVVTSTVKNEAKVFENAEEMVEQVRAITNNKIGVIHKD